jgi:hypothetical protein
MKRLILSAAVSALVSTVTLAYTVDNSYDAGNNKTYVLKCNNGSTTRIHQMYSNPNNPFGGYRTFAQEAKRACGE